MVKLKFMVREGALVLRISESHDRFYRRVGHLLKDSPDLEKHWKADKERFSSYSNYHAANNKILDDFKAMYLKLVIDHPELSARQVANFYKTPSKPVKTPVVKIWSVADYADSVEKYLEVTIEREKAKQGCNFEDYDKLLKKLRKILQELPILSFSSLDYDKMVSLAYVFSQHKGYKNTAKTFRALLGKAHKDRNVHFNLSQINEFNFNDYNPDKYDVENDRPVVMSESELKAFLNLDINTTSPTYRQRSQVELYHDFCAFMFYSFFAPCDVIKAKTLDITKRNTIITRRKKTHKPIEIPISPSMQKIIDKYAGKSKYGYIFPIKDDEKDAASPVRDYSFKHFRCNVNVWLKIVGNELGLDYTLHNYVFRHTAITIALDKGLPLSYVSNAAGTGIRMIQKHYYNGNNKSNMDKLIKAFQGVVE